MKRFWNWFGKSKCPGARLDLTINFHHEHFIDPTNCPWVSEDDLDPDMEEHYTGLLRQWKMDEDSIKDKLDDVGAKIDELQASVNKIEIQLCPTSGK